MDECVNVLILSELTYPHGGGAELGTHLLANQLAQSGFSIRVITNRFENEPQKSRQGNLEIFRLPILTDWSGKYSLIMRFDILISTCFRKLFRWADIVYIPGGWYSAIPIAKSYGKVVIAHLHDYRPICSLATMYDLSRNQICSSRIRCRPSCVVSHEMAHGKHPAAVLASGLTNSSIWPWLSKIIKLCDALICVSHAQKNLIASRMRLSENNCRVIYNLLPNVANAPISSGEMAYFGGPSPLKGYDVLRLALQDVKDPVTVHATGFSGKKSQVIGNSTIRFHERLPSWEYERVSNIVQTVIAPSIWPEPLPYVVSEAILRGRLVIASRIGGIPEQLEGCPGGFLFEPASHDHLRELIEHVQRLEPKVVSELACKDKEVFTQRFDNAKSLREFMDLLEEKARLQG